MFSNHRTTSLKDSPDDIFEIYGFCVFMSISIHKLTSIKDMINKVPEG